MAGRYLISIRNIPWIVSHTELEKYFSVFGDVKAAKVVFNKLGLSTGYGFVEFYDKAVMNSVLKKCHVLENEKLSITEGLKYLHEDSVKKFVDERYLAFNSDEYKENLTWTDIEEDTEEDDVEANYNINKDSVINHFLRHSEK